MKRERTLSALADSVTALYTFSVRADWKQFDLDARLWKRLEGTSSTGGASAVRSSFEPQLAVLPRHPSLPHF